MLVANFRHKEICQLLISSKILQFNKHIRDRLEIMDFSESGLLNLRAYNKSIKLHSETLRSWLEVSLRNF